MGLRSIAGTPSPCHRHLQVKPQPKMGSISENLMVDKQFGSDLIQYEQRGSRERSIKSRGSTSFGIQNGCDARPNVRSVVTLFFLSGRAADVKGVLENQRHDEADRNQRENCGVAVRPG